MSTTASCGHIVNKEGMNKVVSSKSYTEKGYRAVEEGTLCNNCYKDKKTNNLILYNEEEKRKWLKLESYKFKDK